VPKQPSKQPTPKVKKAQNADLIKVEEFTVPVLPTVTEKDFLPL